MRECKRHGWHDEWRQESNCWRCKKCRFEYAQANRATYAAKDKQRHLNDPGRSRIQSRKTYARHASFYNHKQDSRRRGYTLGHTQEEWEALCKALDWCCARCGQKTALARDHIIPIRSNESNPMIDHISNIQPLCCSCNSLKHAVAIDYRPDGLIDKLIDKLEAGAE